MTTVKNGDKLKVEMIKKATKKSKFRKDKSSKVIEFSSNGNQYFIKPEDTLSYLWKGTPLFAYLSVNSWNHPSLQSTMFSWEFDNELTRDLSNTDIAICHLTKVLAIVVDLYSNKREFVLARFSQDGNYSMFTKVTTFSLQEVIKYQPLFRLITREANYKIGTNIACPYITKLFAKGRFHAVFGDPNAKSGDIVTLEIPGLKKPKWYPEFQYKVL